MLYLVPTPIGNLRDITLRALDVLKQSDVILCEDTRQTQKLLTDHGISGPLQSFHEHSGPARLQQVMEMLREGKTLALVSDGGMPAISDPGFELVRECLREGIRAEALPGPSAVIPALAASGLATDAFSFFGF
ncbi:MAG: rRNA small subunit methyltransferase 1, partial [candidate division Zixibacteria bacterium]|nr:rRNA small subunit methyltransferase 1 [candidate division Zixibacteria bacterium]